MQISGADGELIERLMHVIDADPVGEPFWWVDVSGVVADAVGGCEDITPDSNRPSIDGHVSWEHQGNREVVARVMWMNRLRLRLAAIIGAGIAEDFLVVAIRDHVGRRLDDVPTGIATPATRTRYDDWIAEQATGGDNFELSLVARALMGPTPDVDLADVSGRDARWSAAIATIGDDVVGHWRAARTSATISS